eukprot:1144326-Pelagomonas_calceolata.AAC.1
MEYSLDAAKKVASQKILEVRSTTPYLVSLHTYQLKQNTSLQALLPSPVDICAQIWFGLVTGTLFASAKLPV